jgi:hypothetical protein
MTATSNPLINKIKLPGKKYRLPSRGVFYHSGELDDSVIDGEVEIFSMTAIDEITLRTPDLLYSGEAIDRVFKRCIPQILKPLELVSKDVDFLLTALRVVSYGNEIEVNHKCEKCAEKDAEAIHAALAELEKEVREKAEEQGYTFEEAWDTDQVQQKVNIIRHKNQTKQTVKVNLNSMLTNKVVEVTDKNLSEFDFTMSNGQEVKLTPVKMIDTIEVYRSTDRIEHEEVDTIDEAEAYIAFILAASIDEVDGVSEKDLISEWIKALPIRLKDELVNKITGIPDWGVDFVQKIKCKKCGHTELSSSAVNPIAFFTIPSKQETKKN